MDVRHAKKAVGGCLLMTLCLLSRQSGAQSNPGIRVHMHGAEGYAADGLLYSPAAQERAAALLLIPNERGVTRRITDAAANFLAAGYVVVVVDLNRGLAPDAATRTDEQVDHDLNAALEFVCAQAQVDRDGVGLVGWGSGGAAALRLAGDTKIRAIAIDDVAPAQAYAGLGASRAAVLGSFAARSGDRSMLSAKDIVARLHVLAKTVDVKVYPDAERGFDDPEDSAHFKPGDAADIRSREIRFFAERVSAHPTR